MALLVVVVLGVPGIASAGQPNVKAPTGTMSGGVFTGTYSFDTYISCSGGFSFNSSYSNSLEGTNTFVFYGSADGSLFVSIDGGGMLLITSCGDPNTGPFVNVATYTVTKFASPPPTPPPTPTPTPTPTPGGGGGSSGGGSAGSGSGGGGPHSVGGPSASGSNNDGSDAAATPTGQPPDTTAPVATGTSPTSSPSATTKSKSTASSAAKLGLEPTLPLVLAFSYGLFLLMGAGIIALLILAFLAWRSRHLRELLRPHLVVLGLRTEPYWFRLRRALRSLLRLLRRPLHIHARDQIKPRGLSPHHHSGKILAHHHTSYPSLVFLLLVSSVLAGAYSISTRADSTSSLLSLTVAGAPPTTPATIDQPAPNDRFTTSTVTVRGTCPGGVFVEIWRNGAFAGSTICDINNLYSVLVTLVPGQNDLVARVADALGQYGPDSATVTVYYDVPPPPTPTPTPSPTATPNPTPAPTTGPTSSPRTTPTTHPKSPSPSTSPAPTVPPLLIDSARHYYQGSDVDQPVEWTVTITGGHSPYHLTWEWGDGSSDTTTATSPGAATLQHHYAKPGTYEVTIRAKDTPGHEAALQLVVVINGPTPTVGYVNTDNPGNLIYVWPLLILASLIVLSFWLGERHKLAMLRPFLHTPDANAV